MSRRISKFISFILLIALIFSVNISAATAKVNGKEYSKISTAVKEAQSGDTVTFVAADDLNGSLKIENKNIILDMIRIQNDENCVLHIKNSVVTLRNACITAQQKASAIILENSKLILENTEIHSQKRGISVTSSGNSYIKLADNSEIITDGVGIFVDTNASCDIDIYGKMNCNDVYSVYVSGDCNGDLNIYDGAEIDSEIYNNAAYFNAFMHGGKFFSDKGFTFCSGSLCIYGGEINAVGNTDVGGYAVYLSGGNLNITGGIFASQNESSAICINGGNSTVTGGMFYGKLPKGIPENALKKEKLYGGKTYIEITVPEEKAQYKTIKTAAQIAMLEPWGLRMSTWISRNEEELSTAEYDKYGIKCRLIITCDNKKYTSVDEIKSNGAKYYDAECDAYGFFADFRGIYISDFDKYISFAFEVTAEGETVYSPVYSVTMNELIDKRLEMSDCEKEEAQLLTFLRRYFQYMESYKESL